MKIKSILTTIIIAVIVVIIFQAFFFQRVTNFTEEMSYTIEKNEKVWINKFIYGSRLPITLLTLPFTFGHVYHDLIVLPAKRLPGISEIKRGDVIAYNYPVQYDLPIDKKRRYLQRVVGLPGETIEISYGEIRINGEELLEDYPAINKFRVACDSVEFPAHFMETYKIKKVKFVTDPWVYDIIMSSHLIDSLRKEKEILSIRQLTRLKGQMNYEVYPHNMYYPWNKDNFGPVEIPAKGSSIPFNFKNFYLYRDIIEVYEDNDIFIDGETILCNGKNIDHYIFKEDYYFVLGDNRYIAKDSRFWGFLPENHIIGKVIY